MAWFIDFAISRRAKSAMDLRLFFALPIGMWEMKRPSPAHRLNNPERSDEWDSADHKQEQDHDRSPQPTNCSEHLLYRTVTVSGTIGSAVWGCRP